MTAEHSKQFLPLVAATAQQYVDHGVLLAGQQRPIIVRASLDEATGNVVLDMGRNYVPADLEPQFEENGHQIGSAVRRLLRPLCPGLDVDFLYDGLPMSHYHPERYPETRIE